MIALHSAESLASSPDFSDPRKVCATMARLMANVPYKDLKQFIDNGALWNCGQKSFCGRLLKMAYAKLKVHDMVSKDDSSAPFAGEPGASDSSATFAGEPIESVGAPINFVPNDIYELARKESFLNHDIPQC